MPRLILNVGRALASRVANGTVLTDPGFSDFTSIPQLTSSDADLLLVFLTPEGVIFINKTHDPWYRGIVEDEGMYSLGGMPMYRPDEAASPLGCVQRYQYCNYNKQCGSLASRMDATSSAAPLFHLTPSEIWPVLESSRTPDATASRFMTFHKTLQSFSDIYSLLNALGASSLLSPQHLAKGLMGPIPDNQWQLDVTHWFEIHMAAMQADFVNAARGPTNEALVPYFDIVDNEYQRELCRNQVSKPSNM